jgi:hypothetical protein
MQGLLDDPRTLGLLSLGMRLMSTPGKFGSALGTAGLGAVGDMLGATQQQRQQKRQAEQDAMQKAQFDAQQQRLQQQQDAELRRNQYLDAVSPQMGPAMPVDPAAAMKAGLGPQELAMLMPQQKEKKPIVVGGSVLDPETFKPLYEQPQKTTPTALAQMLSEMNALPPNDPRRALYQDAIRKATSHAPATQVNVDTRPKLTKAQERVDTEFGQVYAEFVASGGAADVVKQLQQLRDAAKALKTDDTLTGPFRGQLPESVRSITNPKAVATRNAVEEVVQRNLRVVLGAQFTEKEGERLIARAYNSLLEPEENARRVDRLIQQIESAAKSKIDAARYYEQNGTLLGWRGKLPTLQDIEEGLDSFKSVGGMPTMDAIDAELARRRTSSPPRR